VLYILLEHIARGVSLANNAEVLCPKKLSSSGFCVTIAITVVVIIVIIIILTSIGLRQIVQIFQRQPCKHLQSPRFSVFEFQTM